MTAAPRTHVTGAMRDPYVPRELGAPARAGAQAARQVPSRVTATKTCIVCHAKVPVDADGNIPEGGMPCGH